MSDPQEPRSTVLVVEDEESLRFTLEHNLQRQGYRVLTAARGDDGLRLAREHPPDLVLLDLMLPGIDGIQLCRQIRRWSTVPIIMLTALAGESDRVLGLDAGADDYVAKPFGIRELLARVRAQLRRAATGQGPAAAELVRHGDLEIDDSRREVRKAGLPLRLKPREYDLLLFLARNTGRVVTRERILEEVWGRDFAGTTRTVDVHIRWLRQKIERDPSSPERLVTVRGAGYRFEG